MVAKQALQDSLVLMRTLDGFVREYPEFEPAFKRLAKLAAETVGAVAVVEAGVEPALVLERFERGMEVA